ncbi:MAG: RibD family protein, partial [Planctomycetota bacterium]
IVVDSRASLSPSSQLAQSAGDTPVMVAVADDAPREAVARLQDLGCEVFPCRGSSPCDRIRSLLVELGRRRMTNVLVEGGGQLLGTLFDGGWIDEVHAFIAPKLIGGAAAPAPFAGMGIGQMDGAKKLRSIHLERCGEDVYLRGRVDVRLPSR